MLFMSMYCSWSIGRGTLYDLYLPVFLGRSDGEVYEKDEGNILGGY